MRFAAVTLFATLVGTSAFADSRPSKVTRSRGEGRTAVSRERVAARPAERPQVRRGDDSRNRSGAIDRNRSRASAADRNRPSAADRNRSRASGGERNRSGARAVERDRDRSLAYRGRGRETREDDRRFRGGQHSFSGGGGRRYTRQPYYAHGRVSRVARYGSGYRVWIGGAPYPFFIPGSYYHRDRFRVGLSINLGGFYNPLGYYDYYDAGYGRSYSRGELRGYVESVDYRRDTFVIRNEATGSYVTVVMRDRRREVRPGDYVELYGDWSRSGLFTAYDVDRLN
ncbi:MAG TPA: hypothetical protein VMS98_09695 [Thermoanaerobaculia bacterium]|nr:hypothetical protein [Thermoanaerobaculia bacterium]